jgi:hypothetical protein
MRYKKYDGGDPLAPPVDLAEALDSIGQDVMAGYSPERAMQEFLRRGGRDQRGLDDLARRVAERRRDLLQRHNLDGTLQEVRELLEHAVLEERKQLARDVDLDDSDRAFREMQLDNLPSSTAAAVSELSDYDWQSSEAREDYEKIKDLLGRELLDQRSGVSARFSIAGAETIAAAALHRATSQGETEAVARVVDLETAVDVLGGKVEFETGEEGRERDILEHLLRTATAETVRHRLRGIDFALLVAAIEEGASVSTGEQVTARDFLAGLPVLGESELYDEVCDRLEATNDGERASALELALEGLYLARKVDKDSAGGETVYG